MGESSLCSYGVGNCKKPRAIKKNGQLHRFCEKHRQQANATQRNVDRRRSKLAKAARFAPYESMFLAARMQGLHRVNSRAGDLIVDNSLHNAAGLFQDANIYERVAQPTNNGLVNLNSLGASLPVTEKTFDPTKLQQAVLASIYGRQADPQQTVSPFPALQSFASLKTLTQERSPQDNPLFQTSAALQLRSLQRSDSLAGELIAGQQMLDAARRSTSEAVAIAQLAEQGLIQEASELTELIEEAGEDDDFEQVVPVLDVQDLDLSLGNDGPSLISPDSSFIPPLNDSSRKDDAMDLTPNTSRSALPLDPLSASTLDLLVSVASFRTLNNPLPF